MRGITHLQVEPQRRIEAPRQHRVGCFGFGLHRHQGRIGGQQQMGSLQAGLGRGTALLTQPQLGQGREAQLAVGAIHHHIERVAGDQVVQQPWRSGGSDSQLGCRHPGALHHRVQALPIHQPAEAPQHQLVSAGSGLQPQRGVGIGQQRDVAGPQGRTHQTSCGGCSLNGGAGGQQIGQGQTSRRGHRATGHQQAGAVQTLAVATASGLNRQVALAHHSTCAADAHRGRFEAGADGAGEGSVEQQLAARRQGGGATHLDDPQQLGIGGGIQIKRRVGGRGDARDAAGADRTAGAAQAQAAGSAETAQKQQGIAVGGAGLQLQGPRGADGPQADDRGGKGQAETRSRRGRDAATQHGLHRQLTVSGIAIQQGRGHAGLDQGPTLGIRQLGRQGHGGPTAAERQAAAGVEHTGEHQAGAAELELTRTAMVQRGAGPGAQYPRRNQLGGTGAVQIEAAAGRHSQRLARLDAKGAGGMAQGAQQLQAAGGDDPATAGQRKPAVAQGAAAIGNGVDVEIPAVGEPEASSPHRTAEAGHGGGQGRSFTTQLHQIGHHQRTGLNGGSARARHLGEAPSVGTAQPHHP